MACVMTDKELSRFTFCTDAAGVLMLSADLHGLSCSKARRLLNNLILLVGGKFDLIVIHGYRHSQALKDMLWYDYDNRRLTGRESDDDNLGVTLLKIA